MELKSEERQFFKIEKMLYSTCRAMRASAFQRGCREKVCFGAAKGWRAAKEENKFRVEKIWCWVLGGRAQKCLYGPAKHRSIRNAVCFEAMLEVAAVEVAFSHYRSRSRENEKR